MTREIEKDCQVALRVRLKLETINLAWNHLFIVAPICMDFQQPDMNNNWIHLKLVCCQKLNWGNTGARVLVRERLK